MLDGRFIVRERIGEGRVAVTHAGEQPALQRTVTIKLLRPAHAAGSLAARGLHEEARAMAAIRSPHCVPLIDHGVLPDGAPFLVMPRVHGRSLAQVIAQDELSVERAAGLFVQVLAAMTALHEVGATGSALATASFRVERTADRDHVTLIDLGRDLAEVGASVARDLDAAGLLLSQLLHGRARRRPRHDIPMALDRVIVNLLGRQFPDAASLARAVRDAVLTRRMIRPRRAAIVRGDAPRIAAAYLALARALGDDHDLRAAARELQEGIDLLTAGRGPRAGDAPASVNQLVTSLAALHERAGHPREARTIAAAADRFATVVERLRDGR